ncbi:MAG: glycosyltransferase [Parcubacteria group bacterium]|nr:glycosyltransferase [Parcubacteria group bacterium]
MIDTLRRYIRAYRNKITNKLFGTVFLKHQGKKKGDVLLSFSTGQFTLAPGEFYTDPHSNNWVSLEIARLFAIRGYDIDVIDCYDNNFIPQKKYTVCVDMQYNLARLSAYLPKRCIKIMHLVGSYPEFQNNAEQARIHALEKRKKVTLLPTRTVPTTSDPSIADFLEGYGNKTVHNTYSRFEKKVIPIPVPIMEVYDFPSEKNFEEAKKHFLWFGGGGAILKGLDLVLETFALLPHLKLTIIGPASFGKEFEELYAKELNLPNITRYEKPRLNRENGESMIGDIPVREILNQCGAVLGLSASEGGGGATVQAMQGGVFPIVTPNTGINENAPSVIIENPTIENIKKAVEDFSNLPAETVAKLCRGAHLFATEHHTKEAFTRSYENFIDNVLKLPS